MRQVLGSPALRVQVSMAVLIACFTLPWMFSDIKITYPRLATDSDDEHRIHWYYDERSNRLLVKCRLQPALADASEAYAVSMSVRSAHGSAPLDNLTLELRPDPNPANFNTYLRASLPLGLRQAGIAGGRLFVTIMRKPTGKGQQAVPLVRFNGRLHGPSETLRDVVHPRLGGEEDQQKRKEKEREKEKPDRAPAPAPATGTPAKGPAGPATGTTTRAAGEATGEQASEPTGAGGPATAPTASTKAEEAEAETAAP